MLGTFSRFPLAPAIRRRLLRLARWAPLLALVLLLRKWPDLHSDPGLRTMFDLGYWRELRLYLDIELALIGLASVGILACLRVYPRWRCLFRPAPLVCITLTTALVALFLATTFSLHPAAIEHEFRPVNPFVQPQAWTISLASLLLGAFQQELWNRAILQSILTRLFGNRWIALGVAAVFLAAEQPGHRLEIFCSAVFLGVVFIRTRSVICTTVLHVVLSSGFGTLQGDAFMAEGFLGPWEAMSVMVCVNLGLLLFAFAFEVWRRRRSPRVRASVGAFMKNLGVIALALVLCKVVAWVLHPFWSELLDASDWQTQRLVARIASLVPALVAVLALAWFKRAPAPRELLAIHPGTTAMLMVMGASLPVLAAAIALPDKFASGAFVPMSPLAPHPGYWLDGMLPLVVFALQEEVIYRALVQTVISRLLGSEWAGAILCAALFTMGHLPENAVFVFPAGLLFGVVFMRTRSIVCTTLLHVAMNVSARMLTGTHFTLAVFIPSADFAAAQPLLGGMVLMLTVAFECCWRLTVKAKSREIGTAEMPATTRRVANGC